MANPGGPPRRRPALGGLSSDLDRLPELGRDLAGDSTGAFETFGRQRDRRYLGVAPATEALADVGQVGVLGSRVPGIASDRNLGPLTRVADGHTVNGAWEKIVGHEFVVAFGILIREV